MGYNVIISVERHKNRMNRRLLITGAGGFLGSRICEYFSGRDGYEAVGVTHRELDIEDFVAVSAFIKAQTRVHVKGILSFQRKSMSGEPSIWPRRAGKPAAA